MYLKFAFCHQGGNIVKLSLNLDEICNTYNITYKMPFLVTALVKIFFYEYCLKRV